MKMAIRISSTNGTKIAYKHNIRDENTISKEPHINPNGIHENWRKHTTEEAYEHFFGKALKEYNNKQKRKDRQIKSYYQHIKNNPKKNVAYELIISLGNSRLETVDDKLGREIMYTFCKNWEKRNPNLKMYGCYYHADEEGVPHVHIDYIPIGHGFKKGLKIQNSLTQALKEMGFETTNAKNTAQMQWQKRENKYLEQLCLERGIYVEHPNEKRKHLETQLYKEKQDLLQDYEFELEREFNSKYNKLDKDVMKKYRQKHGSLDDIINSVGKEYDLEQENRNLRKENKNLKNFLNQFKMKGKSLLDIYKQEQNNLNQERNYDDDYYNR